MDNKYSNDESPPTFATVGEAFEWAANNPAPENTEVDPHGFIPREGGVELTRDEVIEFVSRPVWLGWPEDKASSTPLGRPRKKPLTQYDSRAAKWRRKMHHRLIRNPASAKAGGAAMAARNSTISTRDLIFKLAAGLSKRVTKPQRAQKIKADFERHRGRISLSTVQRALRAFDKMRGTY
ncbi:MAG: hypothetical protein HXX19_07695 [Rhodoferax sp.]|nr:hypothetical protein [Rhodoferax sp.]